MIPSQSDVMGVINITPDSFSDGNQFNTQKTFHKRIEYLLSWGVTLIDVGAESTAPFNPPITGQEERLRFKEIFFPWIVKAKKSPIFSIDTYRPDTFIFVDNFLQKYFKTFTIWNDVSGVLDEHVFEILKERPYCSYVYSLTTTVKREDSSHHMNNPFPFHPCEIGKKAKENFFSVYELFKKKRLEKQLILDPAFGFSKTFEQKKLGFN